MKYRNDSQSRYINFILASSKERSVKNIKPKFIKIDDDKENKSANKSHRYIEKLKDLYSQKNPFKEENATRNRSTSQISQLQPEIQEENKMLVSSIRKLNLELQNEKEANSKLKSEVADLQEKVISFCEIFITVCNEGMNEENTVEITSLLERCGVLQSENIPYSGKIEREPGIKEASRYSANNDFEPFRSHRSNKSEYDTSRTMEKSRFSPFNIKDESLSRGKENLNDDSHVSRSSFYDSSSQEISKLKLKILQRRNKKSNGDVSFERSQ